MSPYRDAPAPESLRRLPPWKSKGPVLFAMLVVVCTAWVVAPRTPPAVSQRAVLTARTPPGTSGALTVTWPARIVRSGLAGLEIGAACEIIADVGAREGPVMQRVVVTCAEKIIYRSTPNPATSQSLTQRYGKTSGTIVFEATYDDGMRAGPRLRMATAPPLRSTGADGSAQVFVGFGIDDGVDLAVSPWSEPRPSAPIGAFARAAFDRAAFVTAATGKRPVQAGTACRMQMIPIARDRCDVTVDCRPSRTFTREFRGVRCNAEAAAGGAELTLDDSMDRADAHAAAVLHFASIDRPFSITARVPETWMLELTLLPKMD